MARSVRSRSVRASPSKPRSQEEVSLAQDGEIIVPTLELSRSPRGAAGSSILAHLCRKDTFYLGVEQTKQRINSYLMPVISAVTDETHGFDLAVLKVASDKRMFLDGFPCLSIADYGEIHEMMEVATCGFPLGEALHNQIGTVTSSFTKGMISSVIPAAGVPREHVRGFQLDLTATNGNSGGPVFSVATGQVIGVLQGGVVHPHAGQPVQGLTKAEPIYPLLDTDILSRLLKCAEPTSNIEPL